MTSVFIVLGMYRY